MTSTTRARSAAAVAAGAAVLLGAWSALRPAPSQPVATAPPVTARTTTTTTSTTTTTTTTLPVTTTTEAPPDTEPPAPPPTPRRVAPAAAPEVEATVAAAPVAMPEAAPAPAAGPSASPAQAARSLALLNGWRTANGLPALAVTGDAQAKAQAHAEEMAASGSLWHTNLTSGLEGWSAWAENVGYGSSADVVHDMFRNSGAHNANMLSPNMTHVGVGAAVGADGNVYISQDFVG